ncbi:MAG: hypothetical protein M1143_02555 [Candidatus Thermoplasmatota archaeon]|jgi:flagellar biosynthesis/type III secretory pathway M-ring protein FliF/YscJ|nr:hypothetical protein [Candidatus Thermoplasmatota archaeon]
MLSTKARKGIGLGLGAIMTLFVLVAAFQGLTINAASMPPQSQYTTPGQNQSGLPVADYAIIGVVIAIIVAGLLYFLVFGRKGGAAVTPEEESEEGADKDGEESEEEDSSSSSSDYKEDDAEDSSKD